MALDLREKHGLDSYACQGSTGDYPELQSTTFGME